MTKRDSSTPAHREGSKTDVTLRLIPKYDKNDDLYHIARCDAPMLLDLRECTIFVFTGDNPMISIRRSRPKRQSSCEDES